MKKVFVILSVDVIRVRPEGADEWDAKEVVSMVEEHRTEDETDALLALRDYCRANPKTEFILQTRYKSI